jgi:hypothetical protein
MAVTEAVATSMVGTASAVEHGVVIAIIVVAGVGFGRLLKWWARRS